MSVLCIIPARKGSKGVKKKNLKKIGEYSLVERALFVALNTPEIDDIIVSTDSIEIQHVINKYGEYCPFIRPDNLATDTAKSLDVILHSLHWAQKHLLKSYTYIVLLEPPTPFRLSRHVSSALEIIKDKEASSVVSLISVGDHHPIRMKKINKDLSVLPFYKEEPQGLRRQDQEKVYIRNCAVYVFDVKTILSKNLYGSNQFGFKMDKNLYGINIDEEDDLLLARAKYDHFKKNNLLFKIEEIYKIENK